MAKYPRLLKRGGRYYVRARVPADLVETLGKREIKKTLGTSDYREARERLPLASAKIDAIFAEARRKLRSEPVTQVSDTEIEQIVLLWFHDRRRDAATRQDLHHDPLAFMDELAIDEAELVADNPNALAFIHGTASKLLERHNVSIETSSREHHYLCELLTRAELESVRRDHRRLKGDLSDRSSDPLFEGIDAHAAPQGRGPQFDINLGELADRYMDDPARSHLSDKTKGDYRVIFKALKELVGQDTAMSEQNNLRR